MKKLITLLLLIVAAILECSSAQQPENRRTGELKNASGASTNILLVLCDDRATAEPERLAAMKEKLVALYHEVRAEIPVWPAWADPGYEARRIEWPDYKAAPPRP